MATRRGTYLILAGNHHPLVHAIEDKPDGSRAPQCYAGRER